MKNSDSPADLQDSSPKQKSKYGTKVPYISLEDAIRITKGIPREGGLDGSFDALVKVTGNSSSSSSFQAKLSVLRGFGILTVSGQSYSLTDIGRHIAQPDLPEQEAKGVFDAFCSHSVLKAVWENYKGKILPKIEYIANYLEKEQDIPTDKKEGWANYIVDAMTFTGLVHDRDDGSMQVLMGPSTAKKTESGDNGEGRDEKPVVRKPESLIETLTKNPGAPNIEVTGAEVWGVLSQRRISGGRKAVIAIPDELLQDDIDMLNKILDGIKMQLDGLKKYE